MFARRVMTVVAGICLMFSQAHAEEPTNYTKSVSGGSGAVIFSMGGLLNSAPGAMDGIGAGGRYMLNNQMGIRAGLGLNNSTTEFDPAMGTKTKDEAGRLGMEVGLEYLLTKRSNLLFYTGGLLIYSQTSDDPEGDKNETDTSSITVSGLFGATWFFTHNVSAGAEYRLGLQMDGTETPAGESSVTTIGVGSAAILTSFWF